ncbi:hypothetical protein L9F63_005489, partial [Diploptera punctata]
VIYLLQSMNFQLLCKPSDDSEIEVIEENGKNDDDGIFKPTHEWQKIREGQSIPRGLHVRLNLETGEREAKLIDDNEHTDLTHVAKDEELSKDELQEAIKKIPGDEGITPEDIERVKKNFRPYETLKKELEELELNIQTDLELMNELLAKFKSGDDEEKLNSLTDLEYLVHQFDNAREFIRAGGLVDIVLPSLNSSSSLIRAEAITLLGSASQSNTAVQIAALESGSVAALLRVLALDRDPTVRSRSVYALSCLVRRFPTALHKFVTDGGLGVFANLFQSESQDDLKLQVKVVTLLHDLVLEIKETEKACERNSGDAELLEKQRQYKVVKMTHHLVNEGWCERLPRLLQASPTQRVERRDDLSSAVTKERPVRPEHDVVEKVVTAMLALVDDCRD